MSSAQKSKELAVAALYGVMFSLVPVTFLSFAECFLPVGAWEGGSIKTTLLFYR